MKQTALILGVLEDGPQPSRVIAELTGISLKVVGVRLSEMKNHGMVKAIGTSNDSLGRPRNLWAAVEVAYGNS